MALLEAPTSSEPSVSIAVRSRGELGYNKFWVSLINMNKTSSRNLIPAFGYGAAEAARFSFRQFLTQTQDTHLLMLDDDVVLAEETLNRLLSRNLPMVGALSWTRAMPPLPTLWRGLSGVEGGHPSWWVRQDDVAKWFDDPRISAEISQNKELSAFTLTCKDPDLVRRTDVLGLHCTLIRREVIAGVGEPFLQADDLGVREDFDFCQRVARAGFDIHVDTSCVVGHVIAHPIRPLDYFVWSYFQQQQGAPQINGGAK